MVVDATLFRWYSSARAQREEVASDVAETLLLAPELASALHVWLNSVRTLSSPQVSLANSLCPALILICSNILLHCFFSFFIHNTQRHSTRLWPTLHHLTTSWTPAKLKLRVMRTYNQPLKNCQETEWML